MTAMLGKLAGGTRHPCGLLLLALPLAIASLAACAHAVPQDLHSGADGKPKGAKAITIDSGEGKAKGVVTYPGGDRVDWKSFELPDKQRGSVDLKLTWVPPRPGLQLAFDVFDPYGKLVAHSKKESRSARNHARLAHLDSAAGKYLVRIYAIKRGDAGTYKFSIEFAQSTGPMQIDLTKVDIPAPPRLAAIPAPEVPCDPYKFDASLPACKTVCPPSGAPAGWPACKDVCPDPPDVNKPACWASMPCPNPPDRRVRACVARMEKFWPPCNLAAPDPDNPRCDHATAPPVTARIINLEVQGRDSLITLSAGADQGVSREWSGHVLRGDTDSAIDGGDITIIRVAKRQTIAKVHLTPDQLNSNPRVKLTPPPKN